MAPKPAGEASACLEGEAVVVWPHAGAKRSQASAGVCGSKQSLRKGAQASLPKVLLVTAYWVPVIAAPVMDRAGGAGDGQGVGLGLRLPDRNEPKLAMTGVRLACATPVTTPVCCSRISD